MQHGPDDHSAAMTGTRPDTLVERTSVSDEHGGPGRADKQSAWRWGVQIDWCRDNRWSLAALGGALVVFLTVTLLAISEHAPLGHDESVYANRGRFFSGELDDGTGYWSQYRAPGLPFMLGVVFRLARPSDTMSRLVIVAFGLIAILAVFMLATAITDARAGAAAAVLLVLSSGFTRHAALIFIDVPGMALSMSAITITFLLWRQGRLRPAAYIVVPLLAMASTYVRFGAPATLAPGMVAVVVVLAVQQWRLRAKAFVLEVIGLAAAIVVATGLVLLVPWFTSQPIAPLRAQQAFRDAKGIPMVESVDDFIAIMWPDGQLQDFFHPAVFWTMAALIAIALIATIRVPRIRPAATFGLIGWIGTVTALNVNLSLIQTQYLVLAIPYLVIVAGAGFSVVLGATRLASPIARAALALTIAGAVVLAAVALNTRLQDGAHSLSRGFGPIRESGFVVRSFGQDDCVVLTGTAPQVGWYSRCRMSTWTTPPVGDAIDLANELREQPRKHEPPMTLYVVDILKGKREPDSAVFDSSTALEQVGVVGTPADGSRRYVRVFEVLECLTDDTCPTT